MYTDTAWLAGLDVQGYV